MQKIIEEKMDKIFRMLINAGCDVNAKTTLNTTVFTQLITMIPIPQVLESINIFLENWFDLNHVGPDKKTYYQNVKMMGYKQVIDVVDEFLKNHPKIKVE